MTYLVLSRNGKIKATIVLNQFKADADTHPVDTMIEFTLSEDVSSSIARDKYVSAPTKSLFTTQLRDATMSSKQKESIYYQGRIIMPLYSDSL